MTFHTDPKCSAAFFTPWVTVCAMFTLYILLLLWFCRHGRKLCLPIPDNIYPYSKRLKQLKKELRHLLVEDVFIELTDHKVGTGAAGFVFKGYVYPQTQNRYKHKTMAAVKMTYPFPKKSVALLEEAARMVRLDHPCIVKLIAISQLSFSALRPMLAIEWLAGGSLSEYFIQEIRSKEEDDRPAVYVRDVVRILTQVAQALQYLHEMKDADGGEYTHRDVAARNVLLTCRDMTRCDAKLGDFGLPIDFGPRLPIPWLPPEIVSADRQVRHRPESDVWMFGVFAWECATLGAEPHHHRSLEQIQQAHTQPDRGLPCPPDCPAIYYDLILSCMADAYRRPLFSYSESSSSIPFRLKQLSMFFEHSQHQFEAVPNMSNCSCSVHRCRGALPSAQGP